MDYPEIDHSIDRMISRRRMAEYRQLEHPRQRRPAMVAAIRRLEPMRNPDTCVTCGSRFDAATPVEWQCPDCEAKA